VAIDGKASMAYGRPLVRPGRGGQRPLARTIHELSAAADDASAPGVLSRLGVLNVLITGWGECMNNPEVTMHEQQQPTRFDALEKATTAAGIAISLVMRVPAPLKPIADQVIRSASSVPANIAEGSGRSGRDRVHYWRIAYGSAKAAAAAATATGRCHGRCPGDRRWRGPWTLSRDFEDQSPCGADAHVGVVAEIGSGEIAGPAGNTGLGVGRRSATMDRP